MAYKQPVMPYLFNVEAAGFEPADVSAGIAKFVPVRDGGVPGASR